MIKTIVLEGDSHTWGQGADGEKHFFPPVQGGEKRFMPFIYPCYANRIREAVNKWTGSLASEYEPKQHEKYSLCCKAGLFRIQLFADKADGKIKEGNTEIYLDGELRMPAELNPKKPYVVVPIFCPSGEHELKIINRQGNNIIYRVEAYYGQYAVINSGIGSTSLSQYLKNYWQEYICVYQPKIIIGEANTINDWLSGQNPDNYQLSLLEFIDRAKRLGAEMIIHTAAPIRGPQKEPWSVWDYDLFIERVKQAAQEKNISLADTNTLIKAAINEEKDVFWDDWHVNKYGHDIYASEILNILKDSL